MPDTVEHLKDCRYCYKKISSCATFCPNCGRSQSFTRNNLLFLGSTIGIVTFLISAAVYLWNEGNFFYEMAFGKDELVVHSLLEDDDAVVFNRGYRGLNLLRLKVNPCLSGCNPHPLYVGCAVIRQARVSEWKLMF